MDPINELQQGLHSLVVASRVPSAYEATKPNEVSYGGPCVKDNEAFLALSVFAGCLGSALANTVSIVKTAAGLTQLLGGDGVVFRKVGFLIPGMRKQPMAKTLPNLI